MSGPHVTVTLVPLFGDTHLLRTIALTKHDMPVAIGRASKRETRKRSPATENAWFESRVMSRDHAFLKISPEQNMVFISDRSSTHGTYLNDIKLATNVDHPLFDGDIIRFGVDVDRGHEIFEALEVRCKVQWPKPQFVVIPDDDEDIIKLDPSPSRNSFSVPDDSDSEPAESVSNNSSEDSVAKYEESTGSQPENFSLVSLDSGVKDDKHLKDKTESQAFKELVAKVVPTELLTKAKPKDSKGILELHSGLLSSIEAPRKFDVQAMMAPDLPTPMSDVHPISDAKSSMAKPVSSAKPSGVKPTSTELPSSAGDSLPTGCYQQVPEIQYNNWTIMRPMFMRLADMAWGKSNTIPDIDHDKRIIHAARRCSLSTESYWGDDCLSFKPSVGTEVSWEPDSEESDTSFHRMPGSLLRYWSVDKRRYWIIYEDEDDQKTSDWWWIVEKPLELLSEELKRQLETETEVEDCHKYWIVRAWEPQMIGGQWCDVAPYWDPDFDEGLLYDDDSADSDEEALSSEECISESDSLDNPALEYYDESHGDCPFAAFDNEAGYGVEWGISEEYPQGDGEEVEYEEDDYEEDEDAEEYDEDSDESENESNYSSEDEHLGPCPQKRHVHFSFDAKYTKEPECTTHTDAVEVSKHVPEESGLERQSHETLAGQSTSSTYNEIQSVIEQTIPGMTKPGSRFPAYSVSGELPKSCQNKFPVMQRKIENTVGVPSFSHGYETAYQDGPFSRSAPMGDDLAPCMAPDGKSPLKRTATEMESSSLESNVSQDTQQVPAASVTQPDLYTISPEAKDAISSALAENAAENLAAFAENERPAKRAKPNHTTSKTLASHATTAVVSALLGGLGTIAMLAALPNEYFQ